MLESLQLSQRQRQQAEERYRAFMNNIPAIATIKDRDGRFLYMNEPMARIYNIKSRRRERENFGRLDSPGNR